MSTAAATNAIAPLDLPYVSEQEDILWALERHAPRYNEWLLSRALPHLGEHVLEIGAGIGTFTLPLAAQGIRVSALEPDEALVSILEKRTTHLPGVEIVKSDIEKLEPDRLKASVDSIICFNVLEHVADDKAALSTMARCLKTSGQLMLIAPAHRLLFGAADEAVDHFRRYQAPALSHLLTEAGFAVGQLRYVNPMGAAGWLVSSCLLRRRTLSASSLKLYERLVPLLRRFDGLPLPVGLSLWARAAKLHPSVKAVDDY